MLEVRMSHEECWGPRCRPLGTESQSNTAYLGDLGGAVKWVFELCSEML